MPFQSDKQRRYMHANLPEIANRWEAKYGLGGIAELNSQLNSLPEYYLPKNQGGFIPSHEAGIYGLAEGGQLVKPGPGRPGYGGPQDWGEEESGTGAYSGADEPSWSGEGSDTPTTTRTREVPPGEEGGPGYISPADQRTLDIKEIISRQEEEKKDVWEQPEEKNWLKTLGTWAAIYTGVAPILGIQTPTVVKLFADANTLYKNIDYGVKMGQKFNIIPKDFSTDEYLASIKNKALEYQKKKEVHDSLPDGHPEKIALSVELEIGKKPEHLGDSGDDVSIKYTSEEIRGTNDAKAELASSRWRQEQKEVDRSKQMAYWRMMMSPYMGGAMGMAAEGGRVPAGYNTGGLSNLFRLKNV
jgi:hypothetical protein